MSRNVSTFAVKAAGDHNGRSVFKNSGLFDFCGDSLVEPLDTQYGSSAPAAVHIHELEEFFGAFVSYRAGGSELISEYDVLTPGQIVDLLQEHEVRASIMGGGVPKAVGDTIFFVQGTRGLMVMTVGRSAFSESKLAFGLIPFEEYGSDLRYAKRYVTRRELS